VPVGFDAVEDRADRSPSVRHLVRGGRRDVENRSTFDRRAVRATLETRLETTRQETIG